MRRYSSILEDWVGLVASHGVVGREVCKMLSQLSGATLKPAHLPILAHGTMFYVSMLLGKCALLRRAANERAAWRNRA
jgi:hypothetical protein